MVKKALTFLLAVFISWTALPPGEVLAVEAPDTQSGVAQETVSAAEESENPVLFAEDESNGEAPAGLTEEPYSKQSLPALYAAEKLTLPEEMDEVQVSTPEGTDGILLRGTRAQLSAGKIQLTDRFRFSAGTVGRITVDGLGDRGMKASVEVYLDQEDTPVVRIPLKNQMGKTGWTKAGEYTMDVHARGIQGEHSVSIRIVDHSDQSETKKLSVLLRSLEFVESSFPVLYFNIDETLGTIKAMNDDPDHDTECYGSVTVQVPEGYTSEYTSEPQSTQTLELEYIRGRGNSTWMADKKPYKVKLSKSTDLFGMGKNKHWVLLANRYDNSLIRNRMTYWLGNQLGMEFTPQCVPVEMVVNGEYYGSYLLSEQIRVAESRVAIDDLEDDSARDAVEEPVITGGYLLSMNGDDEKDPKSFVTKRGVPFFLESPSFEDYKNEIQLSYIKGYVQATEEAIFGKDFKDSTGHSYTDYLDTQAAIDYFWIQNLSSNGDAYGNGSTYLYKKRSGKLFWGPLWDFDFVAWGDLEYNEYMIEGLSTSMKWFDQMLQDPAFLQQVMDRWTVIRSKMEEITRAGGLLDQYYEQTAVSRRYDQEKWGSYEDVFISSSGESSPVSNSAGRSYAQEVEQLRDWINQRVSWVNANLDALRPTYSKITFKVGKEVLETRKLRDGAVIGTLPKAPAKKGYYFMGWYAYGYELVRADMTVYAPLTIKAKYVAKKDAVKAEKLYLNRYSLTLNLEEDTYSMQYTICPSQAYNQTIHWSSSNPDVAAVNSLGDVTLVSEGTATITAAVENGPAAKCKLCIVSGDDTLQEREDFELNKTSVNLKKGGFTQLRIIETPSNCVLSQVNWVSSDESVAWVDENGVVTGVGEGTATILALDYYQSIVRMATVRVTPDQPPAVAISSVKAGKNRSFTARWKKQSAATGYMLQYTTDKGFKKNVKNVTIKKNTLTSRTASNLTEGKTYYVRIRTCKKTSQETLYAKWSKVKKVKIPYTNPPAVALSSVKGGKNRSFTAKWKKKSAATGYVLQYTTDKRFKKNVKNVTIKKNSVTSKTVSGLKKGKTCYVRIRTYKKAGKKTLYAKWSAVKTVKIPKK